MPRILFNPSIGEKTTKIVNPETAYLQAIKKQKRNNTRRMSEEDYKQNYLMPYWQ